MKMILFGKEYLKNFKLSTFKKMYWKKNEDMFIRKRPF